MGRHILPTVAKGLVLTLLLEVCLFKSESSLLLTLGVPSPDFGVNVAKFFRLGGGVGVVVDEVLTGVEVTGVFGVEVTGVIGEEDPGLLAALDIKVPVGDPEANSGGGEDLGRGGASGAFFLLDFSG